MWDTSRGSVIKVHERAENFEDEVECYLRLEDEGMSQIRGLALPEILDHDVSLRTLEISVVQAPCLLDFGKVYLDQEPPYWRDEHIMADWQEKQREMFEDRWPDVQRILADLRDLGIYYVDPTPANIMFGDP